MSPHNRLQLTKIDNFFSEWYKALASIPRDSISDPLLFNIFINDIFLFLQESDPANHVAKSTMAMYSSGTSKI